MLRSHRYLAASILAVLVTTGLLASSIGESKSPDPPPNPPESLRREIAESGLQTGPNLPPEAEPAASPDPPTRPPDRTDGFEIVSEDPPASQNDDSSTDSISSTLLLRTGGVLRGQIEHEADVYTVMTRSGEIQIRARDVEFVCRDLNEAYAQKRGAMFGGTADEHIRLAEWCLRHGLTSHAARELLDARKIDAHHPRLEVIDRWLNWATRSQDSSRRVEPPRAAVLKAHHTEPAAADASGRAEPNRAVADEVVETFTRSIQPLLLNSCTKGGCHQKGGREAFQLDRLALRRAAGRRTTFQNLDATIAWIDSDVPDASRLLLEASRAHGKLTEPPLSGRRAELYEKLAAWVREVAQPRPPRPFEPISTVRAMPVPPVGSPVRQATHPDPPAETPADDRAEDAVTENQILRGTDIRKWQPKDAFDPDQFNRQMHP